MRTMGFSWETTLIRAVAAALLALSLLPAPLAAEETASPGRYRLNATAEGFVRLDTRTGETTHCIPEGGTWRCAPVIEAAGELAGRIDAVAAEIRALGVRVTALEAGPALPPPVVATRPAGPEGLLEAALARLLAVVGVLKHGPAGA